MRMCAPAPAHRQERRAASQLGAVIATDRTLGGLCAWIEVEAPRPVDLPIEGAAGHKAAVVPVILHYSADVTLT